MGYVAAWYDGDVSDRTRLMTRVTYGAYDYDGILGLRQRRRGRSAGTGINRDNGIGRWLDAEFQLTRQVGNGHMVAVGGEYRRNLKQDQAVWDEDPYWLYTDDRRDSQNGAVYVLGEVRFSDRARLNLGIRRDEYSTFGSSTNPRLALVTEPFAGTVAKLIYGSAFRAPNVYELYYDDGGNAQKANPELQPETIRTAEVVLDQALGWRPTARFRSSGTSKLAI